MTSAEKQFQEALDNVALVGYFTAVHSIPTLGIYLAIPAIIGGTIGSYLGSRRLPTRGIAIFLAVVLTIAGCKLILTR